MSFYRQPLDQDILRDLVIALCLPILSALMMGNSSYFLFACLIDCGWIGRKIVKFCNDNDKCRQDFAMADEELKESFFSIRDEFER